MIQRPAPYLPWPDVRLDAAAEAGLAQARVDTLAAIAIPG